MKYSAILSKNEGWLMKEVDPDHGLFGHLLALEVLSGAQVDECKAKEPRAKRVEAILMLLQHEVDECFFKFCEALCRIRRKDLADELRKQAAALPSDSSATVTNSDSVFRDSSAAATTTTAAIFQSTELLDEPDFVDLPPGLIKVIPTARDFYDRQRATAYPMNKSCRGVACIISVFKTKNCGDRDGTDADRVRLEALFTQLQFNVVSYEDDHGLDAQEILKKIKLTAKKTVDTNPPQCYVLFILSHGVMDQQTNKEFVLGTDGEKLSKDEILRSLAAEENLRDTPCLVFFVCCRCYANIRHDAVEVNQDRHFLVAFPCKEACYSWRNPTEGTYYVRCIVKVFMEFAHNTDVETMIEKVKYELQRLKSIQHADAPVSSLKRKLYLFPGITM